MKQLALILGAALTIGTQQNEEKLVLDELVELPTAQVDGEKPSVLLIDVTGMARTKTPLETRITDWDHNITDGELYATDESPDNSRSTVLDKRNIRFLAEYDAIDTTTPVTLTEQFIKFGTPIDGERSFQELQDLSNKELEQLLTIYTVKIGEFLDDVNYKKKTADSLKGILPSTIEAAKVLVEYVERTGDTSLGWLDYDRNNWQDNLTIYLLNDLPETYNLEAPDYIQIDLHQYTHDDTSPRFAVHTGKDGIHHTDTVAVTFSDGKIRYLESNFNPGNPFDIKKLKKLNENEGYCGPSGQPMLTKERVLNSETGYWESVESIDASEIVHYRMREHFNAKQKAKLDPDVMNDWRDLAQKLEIYSLKEMLISGSRPEGR